MSKFEVGQRVKVVNENRKDFGLTGTIQRIDEGTFYKLTNSYWYMWSELELATPPAADAPVTEGGDAGKFAIDHWRMFYDTKRERWHIANERLNNSICVFNAELIGSPTRFQSLGTRPLCADCVAIAVIALEAANRSQAAEIAALRAALEPFAEQWRGWADYAKGGGTDDIVGYFNDYMQPEILARWLKQAALAAQPPADAGSEAGS